MTRKMLVLVCLLAALALVLGLSGAAAQDASPQAASSVQAASALTGYYIVRL